MKHLIICALLALFSISGYAYTASYTFQNESIDKKLGNFSTVYNKQVRISFTNSGSWGCLTTRATLNGNYVYNSYDYINSPGGSCSRTTPYITFNEFRLGGYTYGYASVRISW